MTMTYKHEYSEYTNITNYSPLKKKARMDMISTKVQEETKHKNYSTRAKMSVKFGKTVLLEEVGSDSEEDDFSVDSFHFKPKPFKSKVRKYDKCENFVKFGSIRIEGISSAEFYEQKRLLYEIEDHSEKYETKTNLYKNTSNVHVSTPKEDLDNLSYETNIIMEKCDMCELKFGELAELERHLETEHSEANNDFTFKKDILDEEDIYQDEKVMLDLDHEVESFTNKKNDICGSEVEKEELDEDKEVEAIQVFDDFIMKDENNDEGENEESYNEVVVDVQNVVVEYQEPDLERVLEVGSEVKTMSTQIGRTKGQPTWMDVLKVGLFSFCVSNKAI